MGFKENALKSAGKFLKNCVEHNSTFLFVTAAAGWVLCSAAQTAGLLSNKKISKEEKKFLVPQEILDGTFNILTYATVTTLLMAGAKGVAKKYFPDQNVAVEGAKTLAAIAGGVVSSNIITPILRNKTGSIVKNKMESKNLTPPPPEIHDSKSYPNFRANQPISMQGYLNLARNNAVLSYSANRSALRI